MMGKILDFAVKNSLDIWPPKTSEIGEDLQRLWAGRQIDNEEDWKNF